VRGEDDFEKHFLTPTNSTSQLVKKKESTHSCCSNFVLMDCLKLIWSILLLIPFEEIVSFLSSVLGREGWQTTPSWKKDSSHVYDDRCTYSGYVMQKAAIRGSYAYVEEVWASMNRSQRNMAKLFNNQHFWESTENVLTAEAEDLICHGCKHQQIDSILVDCGHTVLCTTCAKLCTHCPICLKIVNRSPRKIKLDSIHKYDYTRKRVTEPIKRGWSLATLSASADIAF